MNFISFSEYLKTWRGHGLTDQQAAERLLLALHDPAKVRQVQGLRIEREPVAPTLEQRRLYRRASERKDRIARWLESDAQPWRTSQRRDALERAWRRLKAIADPDGRHAVAVTDAPEVLPAHLWAHLNCVDASLVSRWTDDDDDPEAGIFVDWRAGKLTEWDWSSTIEYCGLEVHNTLARPTVEEVADMIRKSSISDQNKFWIDHRSYLNAAGLKRKTSFRDLWADTKNPKRSRGPEPKQIRHKGAEIQL